MVVGRLTCLCEIMTPRDMRARVSIPVRARHAEQAEGLSPEREVSLSSRLGIESNLTS